MLTTLVVTAATAGPRSPPRRRQTTAPRGTRPIQDTTSRVVAAPRLQLPCQLHAAAGEPQPAGRQLEFSTSRVCSRITTCANTSAATPRAFLQAASGTGTGASVSPKV